MDPSYLLSANELFQLIWRWTFHIFLVVILLLIAHMEVVIMLPLEADMDDKEVLLVKPFLKGALQLMAPGDGSPPEDCDLPYDGNGTR